MSEARRWRSGMRLWLPAAAFVALNVAALVGYRVVLAGEGERAERALEARRQELADTLAERQRLEGQAALAAATREHLVGFYGERLGTEGERLTRVLLEVQQLAERAGLRPTSFSYPEEPLEEYGLVERAIVFGVTGTYEQLRRFVNFLELSESFLTLEEVGLAGRGKADGELRISLRLATLFVRDGVDPQRLALERHDPAASEEAGP